MDEGCRIEKNHCDFGENLNFDYAVNCARLLTSQCSCQVLGKFYIDNSTAKFISLVVQIYLAGLAIANSFEKMRLTTKENHVA